MSISNYTNDTRLTNERREQAFREALTFDQFIGEALVNQDAMKSNFEAYQLSEQELAGFDSLPEPVEVLVLAHDWCGDVVANLPLFGKISSRTDKLKLHILPRDPDNQDIAELYLHADGRNHLPTYIFFNQAGEELGVFIERPSTITELFNQWVDNFWNAHPDYEGRGKAIGELEDYVKESLLGYFKEQRAQVLEQEKEAIIKVIHEIVS
ncbi:thioredoxin family protein [Paenibacillus solisilvae]|uniref:Thioredoxin family protein n=1 Tax=Paenibacillus solisilvae TaxID=2486751 RepID=A0ABW0VYX8_9BACL